MLGRKVYLADFVYAKFDGQGIVIVIEEENGDEITLEEEGVDALIELKTQVRKYLKQQKKEIYSGMDSANRDDATG